jgi:hypothetical protein
MKSFVLYLLILLFFNSGCNLRKREEQLHAKEAALNQKEQELLLKEKTLQIKEEELLIREHKFDSTIKTDTAGLYNPSIIGIWSVKMTCTETTCAGSAVGDTKTEQWNISYEANTIIAKAMSDDKLVRTYTGIPAGQVIELVEGPHETVSQPATKMIVRLRLIDSTSMDGQREIIRSNCKVIYDLQMEKQQ